MPAPVSHRRVRNGQVELAVREAGDPSSPTIVFVHGYPDTSSLWDRVLERLAPGFHVVAYDVRGAGESSRPSATAAYDMECLVSDFGAVLDAVSPDRPAHLVGHDWGGVQGWAIAASPRLAGRLLSFTAVAGPSLEQVATGTRDRLRRGRVPAALARIRSSWYVVPLCTPGVPSLIWRRLYSRERWARELERESPGATDARYPAPTVSEDGIYGARLYARNIAGKLLERVPPTSVPVPVQLIIAERDRYIPESYYELAERRAPRVVRRTVPGSHWVPRTEPDRLAGWIAEFVREAEKESAS